MTYYGLRISEYRASRDCTLCLGTEAAGVSVPPPLTGAAADEHNLNVVDCDEKSCGHDRAAHRSRPAAMLLDAGPCGA